MAGVFESLYNAYAGTLSSVTNTYVGQWTPIATTAFAASGALYFTLLGFLVFRGAVAMSVDDLIKLGKLIETIAAGVQTIVIKPPAAGNG